LPQSQVLDPAVTFRETANGELVFGEPRALSQCAMDQHHAAGGHTIPPDTGAATSVFMSTRAAGTFLLLRKASRPIFFALLAAVISVMATPTAAHAAFGVQSFHAETRQSDNVTLFTQAGGHPSFGVTSFTINTTAGGLPDGGLLDGGGVLKNIHVDVPPGVIPNPQSLPKCTSPTPILATCGVATQIGTTTILVLANVAPPITAPITVPVFNMEPALGQVSDFAFSLGVAAPRVNIEGGVRDTSDYGPTFDIRNLSGNPPVMGATLSFWGVPGEHTTGGSPAPFLTNPTFCGPPYTTGLTLQSQTGVTATDSDTTPTGATGCDRVPFNPTISVTPGTTRRDSPMGGSVNLHVPAVLDPTHIESSQVKTTALTLPEGLTLNPSGASGLQACTDAQLAKGTHDPVTCPDASKVGIAEIRSATLAAPLTGSLWIGQPQDDDPYRLFLQATGPSGLDVRLKGSVAADPVTGRLTATFADTPQTPFTDFTLTLNGGPRAVLATPLSCGAAVTTSSITPYSGNAPTTPTASFTVDGDGSGGGCGPTLFTPGFGASTSSSKAGGDTSFTMGVNRQDGQQTLSKIRLDEPPGLTGRIPAVPLCAEANAAAGTCADASRIGTVTVAAGAGSEPFTLSGPAYLTGPYNGGPYGTVMVIRAIAGPYDLGTVVVRSAIRVDPLDAHLTIDSDAFPTILKGIPLRLRSVGVTIDRAGFLLNGTACGPHNVLSSIRSVDGSNATPSAQIAVTGCDTLPFKPVITATTSGRPTAKRGGSLLVSLKQPDGQANLRRVSVQLPKAYAARGTTTAKACLEAVYVANPDNCGAVSRVGTTQATTPVLPTSLTGNAYLVGHNARLPTLEVQLNGSGVNLGLSSTIKFGKGYSSTFAQIPDVPVRTFTINLPQGANSLLGISGSVCQKPISMPTNYTAQDGRTLYQTVRIKVEDCPILVTGSKILKNARAQLTTKAPSGGKLTVDGNGLIAVSRTLKKAADAAHVTVSLSKSGKSRLDARRRQGLSLTLLAKVRFVPKKIKTTTGYTTTSTATRKLVLR